MRRVPIGRLALVAALIAGAVVIVQSAAGPRWRTLRPGVEFATVHGDPYCRHGSTAIALLRLDPRLVDLRVHHYREQRERKPLSIGEWQRRVAAIAVFNAGQYYPDFSYMGRLVSGGKVLSARLHPGFRAALVASPASGEAQMRVLDLERDSLGRKAGAWREVAQSFMLFDRAGSPRVRKTDQVARRTVVAEDRRGRLVVITTEGGYTLWELGELLRRVPLQLSHAMAMDGGYEAELCVAVGDFRYASFGRWKNEHDEESAPGALTPLPTVVAVVPREDR